VTILSVFKKIMSAYATPVHCPNTLNANKTGSDHGFEEKTMKQVT
jgi:hypothetical protein